jgi:RNA polymerase sigma factor (sigma-70 family)
MSVPNAPAVDRRVATADDPGDAELISAVRSGSLDAFAALYRRHLGPARGLARQLASCPADTDDLVAEAFTRVFVLLRRGDGPDTAFRAYLLTALRHVHYDRIRQARRVELSDDMTRHDPAVPWRDAAIEELESRLVARALTRLPARWRTVLWLVEVERQSPAEVAPLLGLTPNGLAALAYRAREGLRRAYVQEHLGLGTDAGVAAGASGQHDATLAQIGAWARGGLSSRRRSRVDAHLMICPTCRKLAAEVVDSCGGLARVPLPRTGAAPPGCRRPGTAERT